MTRNPLFMVSCLVLFALVPLLEAKSQNSASPQVVPPTHSVGRVAGRTNLYCAGYIRYQRFPKSPEIVGAEGEPEQRTFAEGDIVFLNWGAQQGIKEGQQFEIIRPKGDVKGVFREKKGHLDTYVRELGQLQVFKVRENTSIAQITFSCDMALLGDLVVPIPYRESPLQRSEIQIDRFAEPSGKANGRLMMARENKETVAVNDFVSIA